MREELTRAGFEELRTPESVDEVLTRGQGTVLVVVNSVCGCAAGRARPGVLLALKQGVRPERLTTVFAGMDVEATQRARSYFSGYGPSSPSIALFQDGRLVHMMERRDIEGREADQIAAVLRSAFEQYCVRAA
jgi:putative YphP/YqiW family bacilliredoxin